MQFWPYICAWTRSEAKSANTLNPRDLLKGINIKTIQGKSQQRIGTKKISKNTTKSFFSRLEKGQEKIIEEKNKMD